MSGNSQFFIFSRCISKNFTNDNLVCFINKEVESPRKYINFGILEKKKNNNFFVKILKKQEIPYQKRSIRYFDITEINFTFIDNGDNVCCLYFPDIDQAYNQNFIGNFYIPIFEKSNIMFAGTGDLISIKKLTIKQSQRDSYKLLNSNCNLHKSNCCFIF